MPLAEKLTKARAGIPAWARPAPSRLRAIGRTLSPEEVSEAIAKLDELSELRDKISEDPELNCDDTDEVHFEQHDLAIALRQCSVRAAAALAAGLASQHSGTRFWVAWSLQVSGSRHCIAAIRQAIDREADPLSRKALATALNHVESLAPGPLGLIRRKMRALSTSDA